MLAIDHIVIAVRNPLQAANDFGNKFNITTVQGGRHENWGTYNYLAYFANDCYIEWIGIFDEDKALNSNNPLIKQLVTTFKDNEMGPFQFAIRTENMKAYVEHFRTLNIPFTGPIEGSRKKPNGSFLQWRMLFPEPNSIGLHPFLIEWDGSKNIPEDQKLINKQHLHSICYSDRNKDKFKAIYQVESDTNKIQLQNGLLDFTSKNELGFEIS